VEFPGINALVPESGDPWLQGSTQPQPSGRHHSLSHSRGKAEQYSRRVTIPTTTAGQRPIVSEGLTRTGDGEAPPVTMRTHHCQLTMALGPRTRIQAGTHPERKGYREILAIHMPKFGGVRTLKQKSREKRRGRGKGKERGTVTID
jgi:hypothetical protein